MTETLFIILRPGRYNQPRIAKVSKRAPKIQPGVAAAVVRLDINIPTGVLIPRIPVATVEIKAEHITPPPVTVSVEAVR